MAGRHQWRLKTSFVRSVSSSSPGRAWILIGLVALGVIVGAISIGCMVSSGSGARSDLGWEEGGKGLCRGRDTAEGGRPRFGPFPLFVVVASRPGEGGIRDGIRNSWAKYGTPFCFFIGSSHAESIDRDAAVQREMRTFGDIVLLDNLEDVYLNLTVKTLEAFAWVHTNVDASFVLKTDSDVYVHVPRLLERLADARTDSFFFGRKVSKQKKLAVGKTHKWYVDSAEYPHWRFPPYMLGGSGYVVSKDLVAPIAACVPTDRGCTAENSFASCDVPECCPFQPMRFEDVTVGGIVYNTLTRSRRLNPDCSDPKCQQLRTTMIHTFYFDDNRFVNEPFKYPRACKESFYTMHRIKPERMEKYYRDEKKGQPSMLCPPFGEPTVIADGVK